MNTRSNGPVPSAMSRSSVSGGRPDEHVHEPVDARPRERVRRDARRARGRSRAWSAGRRRQGASEPEGAVPAERADSRIRRAPTDCASRCRSLPWLAATAMSGSPPAAAAWPGVDQGDVLGHRAPRSTRRPCVQSSAAVSTGRREAPRRSSRGRRRAEALRGGDVDEPERPLRCRARPRPASSVTGAPRERGGDRLGLLRAGGDHPDLAGAADGVVGQGDPHRRRLGGAVHADRRPPRHAERLVAREQGGDVPVGPHAEQQDVERRAEPAAGQRRRVRPRRTPRASARVVADRRGASGARSRPAGRRRARRCSASRAWVSLRSGSPSGRNRSSPHHRCTPDQSTASRTGLAATAASAAMPTVPPVSDDVRRGARCDCTSTRRVSSRAARPRPARRRRGGRRRPRPCPAVAPSHASRDPSADLAVDLVRRRAAAAPPPGTRAAGGSAARSGAPAGRAAQGRGLAVGPVQHDVAGRRARAAPA